MHGETVNGLIMGVGWSSTSYVGCEYWRLTSCLDAALIPAPCRICLERLGIINEDDHAALVIRVFWRCV